MKLTHRKEIKIIVDYNDLETLINETYGSNFDLVAQEEANNDMTLSFYVKPEIANYYKDNLEEFKSNITDRCPTSVILNDLCLSGIIESGNYLVHISW
jgi:hypothetical protein